MRQMQKVQLLVASSAILFCLSPISHWLSPHHSHVTVHYQANAQENQPNRYVTNSNSPPLPLIADPNGSMRWFQTTIGHEETQIFALSARTDKQYESIAQAVAIATPIPKTNEIANETYPYTCYFYRDDGGVASIYRMSSTGILKNPQNGILYEPATAFMDMVRAVTHVKESSY